MYDSLLVVAEALKTLNLAAVMAKTNKVSCENETAWEQGATFLNYLNSVSTEGLSGKIRFQVPVSYFSMSVLIFNLLKPSKTVFTWR